MRYKEIHVGTFLKIFVKGALLQHEDAIKRLLLFSQARNRNLSIDDTRFFILANSFAF